MAVLSNLVASHKRSWGLVHLYGDHLPMHDNQHVFDQTIDTAVSMGAHPDKVCVLVPASNQKADQFQLVTRFASTPSLNGRLWADGAFTTEVRAAIALPTADCQSIIIKNVETNKMVVLHGGKPAMTPGRIPTNKQWNVLDLGLKKALKGGSGDPSNLHIYVTGAISGKNYWHEDENGVKAMRPFRRQYGDKVFYGNPADGRLDLFSVTKLIARTYKIPEHHIEHDELCTFDHPKTESYRKTKTKNRNIIVAVNLVQ